MPLENEKSNVFVYPTGEPIPHNGSVTVGDMHGNAIKLIKLLMRYGIISLDRDSFESMVELYSDMEALLSAEEIQDLASAQGRISDNKQDGIARGSQLVSAIEVLETNEAFLKEISDRNQDNEGYQSIFEGLTVDKLNDLESLDSQELEAMSKAIIDARIAYKKLEDSDKTDELNQLFGNDRRFGTQPLVDLIKNTIKERKLRRTLDGKKIALEYNINFFDALLVEINIEDNSALVRLIGDELADRGSNDYYTLRILQRLNQEGVKFNINVSNHSNEFIMSYEKNNSDSVSVKESIAGKTQVGSKQGISLGRLEYLLDNDIVRQQDLSDIIDNVYKPSLRVIDYNLTDDGISIFTHAPTKFGVIKCLADKIDVVYDDSSKEALAETIEKINLVIQETYIKENRLSELFAKDTDASVEDFPLNHIAWNRWNDEQENDASDLRPAEVNGFSVSYYHGHDNYQSKKEHVHNLDTESGKYGVGEKERKGNELVQAKLDVWKKFESHGIKIKGLEEGHSKSDKEVVKLKENAYKAVRDLIAEGGI